MADQLHSTRLTLRAWTDEDRVPYFELASDPEVMQHLTPQATREASDAWIERHRAQLADQGFAYWAVELRESGEFVGAVGLSSVTYEAHFTPAVGVGWRLARQHWGKGYASEAADAALRYGFEARGLDEIVAITIPVNLRSQQVMRRLGMTYSAADDFDHPRWPEGHPLRRCVMCRMSRRDWLARSSGQNSPLR